MTQSTAVIFGATGLTGSSLLGELLANDHYQSVVAFTRRKLDVSDSKLHTHRVDIDRIDPGLIDSLPDQLDVFICLGSTRTKAGSKAAFKKIDYFLPLKLANSLKEKAKHFLIISSLGADPNSSSFYLSVKGQLEADLKILDINQLTIFKPSLLKGDRKEKRFAENLSLKLSKLASPFFSIKALSKYKPTNSEDLARAMCKVAVEGVGLTNARTNIISSDMIPALINT